MPKIFHNAIKNPKRAGRPSRHPVEKFRVKAWYALVADSAMTHDPTSLEQLFQPEHFQSDRAGKIGANRNWDKYRDGSRSPRAKPGKKGQISLVERVGKRYDLTQWLFEHPVWAVITVDDPSIELIRPFLMAVKSTVRDYYWDGFAISGADPNAVKSGFLDAIGEKIWINRGDLQSALDHLAICVLILRIKDLPLALDMAEVIHRNIVKTLGPIAQSSPFCGIYEEFFDWLEGNIWNGQLEYYCSARGDIAGGWRETMGDWC